MPVGFRLFPAEPKGSLGLLERGPEQWTRGHLHGLLSWMVILDV